MEWFQKHRISITDSPQPPTFQRV